MFRFMVAMLLLGCLVVLAEYGGGGGGPGEWFWSIADKIREFLDISGDGGPGEWFWSIADKIGELLSTSGDGGPSKWGWYVVSPFYEKGRQNLDFMLDGLAITIQVSGVAIVFSIFMGLLVALPGLSSLLFLRWINRIYVEFFRSIPMLAMVLWIYYALPELLHINLSPFWAGVVALALSDSAFEAEIFRGGIQSVGRGQIEAAQSIGLNKAQVMRYVTLPQAIPIILPPLGNQLVYMLKMSSLISFIGLAELTRQANELNSVEYRPLEIYSVLALEYLALVLLVSSAVRYMERRLARKRH